MGGNLFWRSISISIYCIVTSRNTCYVLFRKSTLKGWFKLRHVTKQDLFLFRNFACLCCFRACLRCFRACLCCFGARGVTNENMFLFRKLWLWGSYKSRHVTNRDVFLLTTVHYLPISIPLFSFRWSIKPWTQIAVHESKNATSERILKHCIVESKKVSRLFGLNWVTGLAELTINYLLIRVLSEYRASPGQKVLTFNSKENLVL